MNKFTLKLNQQNHNDKHFNKDNIVINSELINAGRPKNNNEPFNQGVNKKASRGRNKGTTKALNKKKVAVVRGYCTKQDKLLFAAYCKSHKLSESSYIEKCIKRVIKTMKATEKG